MYATEANEMLTNMALVSLSFICLAFSRLFKIPHLQLEYINDLLCTFLPDSKNQNISEFF